MAQFYFSIVGILPERLLHTSTGSQSSSDLSKSVLHAVTSTMAMTLILQPALPTAEAYMNHSFYRGLPIDGAADQNKLPEERYSARISDTAKAIGASFGVSPKKIEHLVKGYAGTNGGYVLGASDMFGVTKADTPLSQYPVIKAIYQGSNSKPRTKFADDFYEALDAAHQAYGSFKRAREIGDNER